MLTYEITCPGKISTKKIADWLERWPTMIRIRYTDAPYNKINFVVDDLKVTITNIPKHLNERIFRGLRSDHVLDKDMKFVPYYQLTGSAYAQSLWPSGILSDTELVVDGVIFYVHRAILSAACPFFMALFTNNMQESNQRRIVLPELSPDVFRAFLGIVYGHKVALTDLRLLVACQRFGLKNWLCEQTLQNVIEILFQQLPEEDVAENLALVGKLYVLEQPAPGWFIIFFFHNIMPSYITPINELLHVFPEEWSKLYHDTEGDDCG